MAFEELAGFPGLAVRYDPAEHPYFKQIVIENLTLLRGKDIGMQLLREIATARPASRGDFPDGINVVLEPFTLHYAPAGHSLQKFYDLDGNESVTGVRPSDNPLASPPGCRFHIQGTSANVAVDPAASNLGGTVCRLRFSNAQVMQVDGAPCWPHITLAHELIHALHSVTGRRHDTDEENWTTGVGAYAAEPMCENAFREAFGLPRRDRYGI